MKPTTTLATCRSPDGAPMLLQQHDGEYFLKVDGVQLMSTTATNSEQLMAEIGCARLPQHARLLIGGLGFGFTLRRVLELCPPQTRIDVAELMPEIVAWNRGFLHNVNGALLDDPRVHVHISDVNVLIDRAEKQYYDAILLDVDNSPDALVQNDNARLYRRDGLTRTKAALQPGGRVVYWSAHPDKAFARSLSTLYRRVDCVGAKAYPKAKRYSHTLIVADA